MSTKFNTRYNYKPTDGVKMSNILITEQTGYQTTKEIVESMQAAGKRLEAYRHGLLDTIEGEFDEEVEDAADIYELDPVDLADRVSVLRYRAQNERKIPEPPSEANTAPSTTEPEPVKKELTSEPEQ